MKTIDKTVSLKTAILACAVCVVVSVLAVYGWSVKQGEQYQDRIDTITELLAEARIANLDATKRVAELENLYSGARTDLDASRQQIDFIKSGIGSLESGLEEILRLNRASQQAVANIIQRDERENNDP